ncbi:Lipase maturation factor 2 [Hondaea fermentalgiana]|uniref:Lipase maturation factor 2 n=1 Tax=Hondaea fermentalgiana TaxID=2315210 RepID=A0A2R5GEB8_9STRA|nr:Lipase maturation factor 2 [Hondaea fermentalgiana]|eukprot:GBG29297.1 Lipase maturation factor 2 [Hondaea fermentalgiana]
MKPMMRTNASQEIPIESWIVAGMRTCYLWAFASLFVQWPGLFGPNGLVPVQVESSANHIDPIAYFAQEMPAWLGVSEACELALLLGTGIAIIATLADSKNCVVMAALWILYGVLQQRGRIFLSFQWDILLLEAGFICVWLATKRAPRAGIWSIRFLLFKLMFMSGIVKIQSGCPTWLSLTALDYHFASQCLPTPLAWYAANFTPSAVLRFSVAATLFIEIPATFLILAPFRTARILGFLLQVILQIGIMLTGNYNFFNILTVVLCLSLLAPDVVASSQGSAALERDGPLHLVALSISRAECTFAGTWLIASAGLALCIHYSLSTFVQLDATIPFPLFFLAFGVLAGIATTRTSNPFVATSALLACVLVFAFAILVQEMENEAQLVFWKADPKTLQAHVKQALPWILGYQTLVLGGAVALDISDTVRDTLKQIAAGRPRRFLASASATLGTLLTCSVLVFVACISAVPLTSLDQPSISALVPGSIIWAYQQTREPIALVHSYGLFRRMTGIGAHGQVARPEVIFEVELASGEWHEVDFLYKPGAPDEAPRFVTPHQPRLDWQMWFAALSNYQSAPWTVHFADKVLRGSHDVYDLVPSLYALAKEKPIQAVRAKHFEFAYTQNMSGPEWWVRDMASERQYLPEIRPEDQSVQKFLAAHGWRDHDVKIESPFAAVLVALRPYVECIVWPEALIAIAIVRITRRFLKLF